MFYTSSEAKHAVVGESDLEGSFGGCRLEGVLTFRQMFKQGHVTKKNLTNPSTALHSG